MPATAVITTETDAAIMADTSKTPKDSQAFACMQRPMLSEKQADFCKSMTFLFWWKKPEELCEHPHRTLAGVMDLGGVGEWAEMERIFPREFIIQAIETAVCGEFHGWSWKFWRMRYGLDADTPLPARLPGAPPPSGEYWFKALQRHRAEKNDDYERLRWTYVVRGIDPPDAPQA